MFMSVGDCLPLGETLFVDSSIKKNGPQIQCSGEAVYTGDLPTSPGEVYAAFAVSGCSMGEIDVIDPSEALVSL